MSDPVWEQVGGPGDTVTRVVLVRHGETDWNARGIYQGWQDVPLSERGREQAHALARTLDGLEIDAAYTSPLGRARETADIVLAGRGVRPIAVEALRELSYGRWEGATPEMRRAEWPALDARWAVDPWSVEFPGGESLPTLAERAIPIWDRLLAAHVGDTVLVSGHGHLNRALLLHARSQPRAAFWSIEQPNGSATRLAFASTSFMETAA